MKAPVYARFGNTSLLRAVRAHLPPGGAVLDIGCASGGLLAELADVAGYRAGAEIDPEAATAAAQVADRVVAGPFDPAAFGDRTFDVISMGDVLEHVPDPLSVLRDAATLLSPTGVVAVSLPNVAHWTIRLRLLRGGWRYESDGILDDTHLRFFTWTTATELVESAGLEVVDRISVVPPLHNHVPGVAKKAARAAERFWQGAGRRRPNLLAYQMVFVARSPST